MQRRGLWLAPLLLLLGGCTGLEQIAPVMVAGGGAAPGTLHEGRRIYLSQCASCHTPLAITDYSRAQWATIMPDMAERTKLNGAQTAAVTAYVAAVLQNPPKQR